jgi:DNA-binding NarL/FixJ family response regulator
MRAGVAAALEEGGLKVCAQVADAPAAVEAALRKRPDVCLLDVHMPGGGVRAAAEITSSLPRTAVVMLTVSDRDEDLFSALRAGASGYLLKDTDAAELREAVRAVLNGDGVLSGSRVGRLIEEFRARGGRRLQASRRDAGLSDREWDVLDLLREGQTTGEIAYTLSISEVTVRRHISAMRKKLDVGDRQELLRVFEERPRMLNDRSKR